ncbi:MAG: hypothetical protein A2X46_09460 [Lentisphaerae bacterium GWF2_57_35]|nr:MAG: hypothetical protein A2X46_09460 [Lentisphaerae bacterium GWF2_57_35]
MCLGVLFCMLSVSFVQADPVSPDEAMALANAALNPNGQPSGYSAKSVEAVKDVDKTVLYYVVYCNPRGYMIVASDDSIEPIIAFSDSGTFEKTAGNPLFALLQNDLRTRHDIVESIQQVDDNARSLSALAADVDPESLTTYLEESQAKWAAIEATAPQAITEQTAEDDPFANESIQRPVMDFQLPPSTPAPDPGPGGFAPAGFTIWVDCLISSSWDQYKQYGSFGSDLYNLTTPSNRYAGCGPVAVGQVMKYHKYPRGLALNGSSNLVAVQQADGSITTNWFAYQATYTNATGLRSWTNFLDEYKGTSSSLAWTNVADLLRDVGVAAGATYYTNKTYSTLANLHLALTNIFSYPRAVLVSSITATNTILNFNMLGRKPVIMAIHNSAAPTEGHIAIVDGLAVSAQGTVFHHLNMGWGEVGQNTAWYNLPNIIAYNSLGGFIYNIMTNGAELVVGRVVASGTTTPMSNAVIVLDGVTNGATDVYGTFGVDTVAGIHTVTVSKVGYVSQTYVVTNTTSSGNAYGNVYRSLTLTNGGDMSFSAVTYSSNIVLTWSDPTSSFYPAAIHIIATTNSGGSDTGYGTYWTSAVRRTDWFNGYAAGGRVLGLIGCNYPSNLVFSGNGSSTTSLTITNLPLNKTYYFKMWCSNATGFVQIDNGTSTAYATPDANKVILYFQETNGSGRAYYMMPPLGAQVGSTYALKAQGYCATNSMSAYKIAAVGDFNTNGVDDILWQRLVSNTNLSLNYEVWLMNNSGLLNSTVTMATGLTVSSTWTITSVNDVTGDGHGDVVLSYDSGRLLYYYYCSNGEYFASSPIITNGMPFNASYKGGSFR